MPKRQRVKRFDSVEVQGEGSFVTVALITLGEQRKLDVLKKADKEGKAEDGAVAAAGVQFLKTHVLQWNWVDDDGEPMPQIASNHDVLEELTMEEVNFLFSCFSADDDEAKN